MNYPTAYHPDVVPDSFGRLRRWIPTVLCGLTGFLCAFTVSVVGLLPIGELILLALFPWVLIRMFVHKGWPTRIQQLGWYKMLVVLVGVMLMGYVISDLYRGTAGPNLARGWARVAFLGIDLVTIVYLVDCSWRRLYLFVIALSIGGSINALVNAPLYDQWWEFGVGGTATVLVMFLAAGRYTFVQVLMAMAIGIVSLSLGARSLGGIAFLTSVLFGLRYARGFLRWLAYAGGVCALVVMVFAVHTAYLRNLDKVNSNTERESMLETAAESFIESPFIGQGSWFTATKMLSRLEEKRASLDPTFHGYSDEEARTLAIHSQLLVSLAEGGILGGAFFLCYGVLLAKTVRTLVLYPVPRRAFVFYVVLDGVWNLFMSPFSGVTRTAIVLAVCTCLLVVLQRQGELSDDFRE